MRTKMKWSPGSGAIVLGVALTDDDGWVVSAAVPAFGICPDCGRRTRNWYGWSDRSLQDLPVQGKTVTVKLRLSRWRCAHQKCERQTFIDRLPTIASPYARRTRRVSEIVGLLGHSAGGRLGERLMRRLGMPVSDETILRQLKRDAALAHRDATIRVVGIDDWSWRRSWRYGTMIVDLERRSVVDILGADAAKSGRATLRSRDGKTSERRQTISRTAFQASTWNLASLRVHRNAALARAAHAGKHRQVDCDDRSGKRLL